MKFSELSKLKGSTLATKWPVSRAPKNSFSSGPAANRPLYLCPSPAKIQLKSPAKLHVDCEIGKSVQKCNDGSRAPENLFQLGLSYHAVQLFHAPWPTGEEWRRPMNCRVAAWRVKLGRKGKCEEEALI